MTIIINIRGQIENRPLRASSKHTLSGPQKTDSGLLMHYQPYSWLVPSSKTQGTDSHRTISKRSRECWFLIGHKKCFVLLCPIGEQHLLSSFREFVHDGYYLATVVRFVHQAFLTRNEGTTDESKNVSDATSRSRFALRKFCFWRITMFRK